MRRLYPLLLIAGAFAFSLLVYSRLPEHVPVHWNIRGEVDRLGPRAEAAFLLPALALVMWGLMRGLPRIDPRRANYQKFAGTYDLVVNGIVTVAVLLHVLVLGNVLGWPVPIDRVIPAVVGVLLVIVGNALPRARSNWWFGIRTPWTLSSERVWMQTHRVGGYLLLLSGCAMLVCAALPSPWTVWIAVGSVIGASLASVVYSYFAWRRERAS
jgi:uncharacterized membrane protein